MEVFTRTQSRLFADHAIAIDMLDAAIGIGDAPVACDQARGNAALVVDADRIGERITTVFRRGLVVEEARGDFDGDGINVSVFHTGSVIRWHWPKR